MVKWKVVFDVAQDEYEVTSGKTNKPQPESYRTERYERLLDSTVELVPEKRN